MKMIKRVIREQGIKKQYTCIFYIRMSTRFINTFWYSDIYFNVVPQKGLHNPP